MGNRVPIDSVTPQPRRHWRAALAWLCLLIASLPVFGQGEEAGHPLLMSPHANPIVVSGGLVFAANTPADTVDVIDTATRQVVARINVGVDPVGLAVRPDGMEVWVANHVSDSVSVIDANHESPTFLQVIATVQDFNLAGRGTLFDEPVGVAFASNAKAYVALSSENEIAVVDVASREVTRTLSIAAQDPRAIFVRGDRLYVVPFESNNKTQISGCIGPPNGPLCTFDALEHVVNNNNVLSTGITVDIVRHPQMPDRDLFVFDTATDQLGQVVDTVGTLLYGIAVDSQGRVFVAQTEGRNDANGKAGTLNHGLAEMENRAFLNRITRIDCSNGTCGLPELFELEPVPPQHPAPGMALATPFAIQVSDDDRTLVVSAAGSDRLFTVDADSGEVLGRVGVGAVPRGIALESAEGGAPLRAWVLNVVSNSVTLVDLSDPSSPAVEETIALVDPTEDVIRRGRLAFHDADASTTGTFSCESCHPDGHTDQLIWILDTPLCDVPGCTQIPPRITMPVRGLRDTQPYHWDGIPGDPYGGNNTANINGFSQPNCEHEDQASCTRHLADGSLGSTMCLLGACPTNDEGKPGALSASERDDLAEFLLNVPYPPARSRAYDNRLSSLARQGNRVFHVDGVFRPNDPTGPQPNICGACHRFPFLVSTNSPGTGMDAPTWRGAYDRWLVLPQGRTNLADFLTATQANNGIPERTMWVRDGPAFEPVWFMIVEGSTGFHGGFARQTTLNSLTADNAQTSDLLDALERADGEGSVLLQGEGVFLEEGAASPVRLGYDAWRDGGRYFDRNDLRDSWSRAELLAMAANGQLVATLTARIGPNVGSQYPQAAIWTSSAIFQNGPVNFPTINGDATRLFINGRHLRPGAAVFVDGLRVPGHVECRVGEMPDCVGNGVDVQLAGLPEPAGMHFLQVQNRGGMISNDFIFNTGDAGTDNCPEIPNPDQTDSDADGVGDRCDDDAFDFDITAGISGNWFDPDHDGEGWFVQILNDQQALVFWFTHTPPAVGEPASQAWIGGVGQIEGSSIVVSSAQSEITIGPPFGPDFDPERVVRRSWGRFVLSFSACDSGVMYYQSNDLDYGSGSLDLVRLSTIDGMDCAGNDVLPAEPQGAFQVVPAVTGAWYDPSHDGEGWLLEILPDDRALVAWFSYDPQGRQAWFLNVGTVNGNRIDFELLQPAGTDFGPTFDPGEIGYPAWGTMTMTFDDCDSGTLTYASELPGYGSGALELERLTAVAGLACD